MMQRLLASSECERYIFYRQVKPDRSPVSHILEKYKHGPGSNQLGLDRLLCAIAQETIRS
ncbi:hypothetical protein QUB60_01510 [Microcoleus sp. A2-C5]|uniref:hypothetical protein n=1 Tax=unclassified Microcoleus TaxID=2642155 RepID=UPI002FD13203